MVVGRKALQRVECGYLFGREICKTSSLENGLLFDDASSELVNEVVGTPQGLCELSGLLLLSDIHCNDPKNVRLLLNPRE